MRRFLAAIALLGCAVSASALNPESLNPRFGLLLINNAVESGAGAPDALLTTLGVSVRFPLTDPRFTFEPGVEFFWARYDWEDGRAHPTEKETLDAAVVPGIILDAPFFLNWEMGHRFLGMAGLGPALVLRAAFLASGASSTGDVRSIGAWFYQKLRFFYPTAQLRFAYRLQKRFTFELGARWFIPIFNLWDPDSPGFWDHNMIHASMGMRIQLD